MQLENAIQEAMAELDNIDSDDKIANKVGIQSLQSTRSSKSTKNRTDNRRAGKKLSDLQKYR